MLSVQEIKDLVGNRFFEIIFTKKDGTERKLNGRISVSKYVKGTGKLSDKVVGVWDREKLRENIKAGMNRWEAGNKSYRCFLPSQVLWIKVGGVKYNADGEIIK